MELNLEAQATAAMTDYFDAPIETYGPQQSFMAGYLRGVRDEAARKHAADKDALIEFVELWYDRTAGPGESWTVSDLADALLAPGGPLVDVREVQAKAVSALVADLKEADIAPLHVLDWLRVRAAEIREAI